ALETLDPVGCAFTVLNSNEPGRPSPAQVPPATLTASDVPDPMMNIQYSGSFAFTPAGQESTLMRLLPGCRRSSVGIIDHVYSVACLMVLPVGFCATTNSGPTIKILKNLRVAICIIATSIACTRKFVLGYIVQSDLITN